MDQYSAFYQNHMGPLAYLRLMMPFGGLQVLARSGQGLLGQSKELDKPMSKILQDNLSKEQWPRSMSTFSQVELISVRQHTTMLVYYTNLTFLTSKWTSKKSLLSGELRHNWLDMEEGQIPRSLTTQEELPGKYKRGTHHQGETPMFLHRSLQHSRYGNSRHIKDGHTIGGSSSR